MHRIICGRIGWMVVVWNWLFSHILFKTPYFSMLIASENLSINDYRMARAQSWSWCWNKLASLRILEDQTIGQCQSLSLVFNMLIFSHAFRVYLTQRLRFIFCNFSIKFTFNECDSKIADIWENILHFVLILCLF